MDTQRTPKRPQSKHWCFTINHYTEEDAPEDLDIFEYIVVGREIGTNGVPHIQGYCCFVNRKEFSFVKKIFPRAHLEIMRGTPKEASDYCKKDGDYNEWGVLPLNGGQKTKHNYDEAVEMAKKHKIYDLPPLMIIRHHSALKAIERDFPQDFVDLKDCCGEWIWGEPGVGKSYTVRQENPIFYDKPLNKWWDGYKGQSVVLLDDVGIVHAAWLGYYLKRWADKYSFPAEQKGTTISIRPDKIIVTSNYAIEQIFNSDLAEQQAIRRRFKVRNIVKLDMMQQ